MPMGFVTKGSKENVHVDFVDRSDTVVTLAASSPTFDVIDFLNVVKVTGVAATASGLRITLLLDTTVGGVWPEGEYRLHVTFTVGSQVIRKGPYYFTIIE